MDCEECESSDAALTEVEYEVEETEIIPLCDDCRSEYKEGGFVQDLTLVDQ